MVNRPTMRALVWRFAWVTLACLLTSTALVWAAFAGLRAMIGWR